MSSSKLAADIWLAKPDSIKEGKRKARGGHFQFGFVEVRRSPPFSPTSTFSGISAPLMSEDNPPSSLEGLDIGNVFGLQ
jgi:hypothetical protein